MSITEDIVELAAIETLQELGWNYLHGSVIAPDGSAPERRSFGDVILTGRLEAAIARINPDAPKAARGEALRKVLTGELPSLVEENRRIHKLLTEGVDVEYRADNGKTAATKIWLIDLDRPDANDWLAVNQFVVVQNRANRRPDLVLFVNGLPLAVLELKNAAAKNATIADAYNQLQTYLHQIPGLFSTNAVLVTSDGMEARIGSITANAERFMPWRTVDGEDFAHRGTPELETLLRGVFTRANLLALIRDFIVFGDKGEGPFKIIAGYHQFHGAQKAVRQAVEASSPDGDRKIGVIWHTQGSGKSLLMAFFAGLAVKSQGLENPTLVVLTDRNDLDDQLYGTFGLCRDLIRQNPEQAESRADLKRLLDKAAGGVVFTTVQKFSPEKGEETFPLLSDRRNIIVIADEAHRSQYGFEARLNRETGLRRYGYAHYKPGGLVVDYIGVAQNLRNALSQYTDSDRDKTGIDESAAVAAMMERYEAIRDLFHGFDYRPGITGQPRERLICLGGAIDWVLRWQESQAARQKSDEEKKRAHRRFLDMVLELSKAYALASASDDARAIRDEVGFFQAIRAALAKTTATGKIGEKDRAFAVQQLVDRAVASSEIIDILKVAGLQSPDISILSDEFLMEVGKMEKKNLALEALKKLLNGEIVSRSRTNLVESKAFSNRLEEAVARYHAGAISAVEMIQELIELAKDMKAARARGEEMGLSQEEVAFYMALAENESAVEAMGNEKLRVIAHELLEQLRGNVTVDWHQRESARARMRVLVKRILKKYGYPPDLADEAVQTVLAQAEILLREIGS